ncbi:MAG TPA: YihY/virulence factor BrkB family protein [Vicinamibacterales bacterium]
MFGPLRITLTWKELARRTFRELVDDNILDMSAQLAYYFFLALFPAALFLVAIISFIPVSGLLDAMNAALGRVAPWEVISLLNDQVWKIAHERNAGLLTFGMIGTVWSTSAGMTAIITTLNQAYDVTESRPWWRVRLIAIALTIALALFIVISFALVLVGPTAAEKLAQHLYLGGAFEWTWKILQWPVIFALVSLGMAFIYYYAPDAKQSWIWITPGSIVATILWLLISLGFKLYIAKFNSYDSATYGLLGGVIVLLLWFYASGIAVLIGAELNSEIEHASPHGKAPGEKVPGESAEPKPLVGQHGPQRPVPVAVMASCPEPPAPRASDWILGGLVLVEMAALAFVRLRGRFHKIRG